jgi:hypothetical protein
VTSAIFSKRITFPVATAALINFILNLVINNAYHYSLTEMFIAQSCLDHLKEYPEKLWIFRIHKKTLFVLDNFPHLTLGTVRISVESVFHLTTPSVAHTIYRSLFQRETMTLMTLYDLHIFHSVSHSLYLYSSVSLVFSLAFFILHTFWSSVHYTVAIAATVIPISLISLPLARYTSYLPVYTPPSSQPLHTSHTALQYNPITIILFSSLYGFYFRVLVTSLPFHLFMQYSISSRSQTLYRNFIF